jgi:hypothetical protein
MAFKVKVTSASKGGDGVSFELSDKVVTSVRYKTDTPDDENSRSNDVNASLVITGRLLQDQDEETKKMAMWTLKKDLPYKNVVAQHIASKVVMREYTFTQAFVVDYVEEFSENEGNGKFTLVLKQEKSYIDQVKIEGGYGA